MQVLVIFAEYEDVNVRDKVRVARNRLIKVGIIQLYVFFSYCMFHLSDLYLRIFHACVFVT